MCNTCGCASGETRIEGDEHHHDHHHHDHHHHDHHHPHHDHPHLTPGHFHFINTSASHSGLPFKPTVDASGSLHYGKGEAGGHAPGLTQRKMLEIEIDVLDKNNHLAEHNRQHFSELNILALNLVSSPGSGKTTLLTHTLTLLTPEVTCAVIEGDQQTARDAERIRATGVPAIQVNTGKGCHLDAQMIHDATHRLSPAARSLLFIENVGNLVCPASFDLGERHKVAVLSVTEGDDKPLKYPHMFAAASLMILNKIDLLPYVDFDIDTCIDNVRQINPDITVMALSATTGEGMTPWLDWLRAQLAEDVVCA